MHGEYEIKLREGVTLLNLATPRRIPIPLPLRVREESKRMEDMGVIEKIDQPTEWCSPGKGGICGDVTQLNKAVLRKNHPMPTTEQTCQISRRQVSKLDANCRFWLRKLSLNSKLLTTFITPWGRYCHRQLPFPISSATEHFQKIMQKILAGLQGVECQMVDILVFGDTHEQHE